MLEVDSANDFPGPAMEDLEPTIAEEVPEKSRSRRISVDSRDSRSSTSSKKSADGNVAPLSMWDMMMRPDADTHYQVPHAPLPAVSELPESPTHGKPAPRKSVKGAAQPAEKQLAWVVPTRTEKDDQLHPGDAPPRGRGKSILQRISERLSQGRASASEIFSRPSISEETRDAIYEVVEGTKFAGFIATSIFLHAILVGVQTEYDINHLDEEAHPVFRMFDIFFCAIFCAELCLRIACYGSDFFTCHKEWRWNIFDSVVLVLQCLDEVSIVAVRSWTASSVPGNFFTWRLAWIPKLIRNARLLRLLRLFQEFRTMVDSLHSATRPIVSSIILLVLMIYTIGVCVTNMVAESARDRPDILAGEKSLGQYYGTLSRSLLSLFQATTGGVDWNDILKPLQEDISPLLAIPFALYIAFMLLAMMNVITGVFVESSLSAARGAKDAELRNQMRVLFRSTDKDRSGMISWEEFASQLEEQDMARCFQLLDIDISEAKGLFTLLDTDGSGEIDAEEFVMGCLRLKGTAKAIDLATLMYFNKRMATWWQTQMSGVREGLSEIIFLLDAGDVDAAGDSQTASMQTGASGSAEARSRRRRSSDSSVESLACFATWDGLKAECSGSTRRCSGQTDVVRDAVRRSTRKPTRGTQVESSSAAAAEGCDGEKKPDKAPP